MNTLILLLKEIRLRITGATPGFFNWIRNFCYTLLAVCVAFQPQMVAVFDELTQTGLVPAHWLQALVPYISTGAIVGAVMATLMVKDYKPIAALKETANQPNQ